MKLRSVMALLFLAACEGNEDPDKVQDVDGDGVEAAEDCDDNDAAVGTATEWPIDLDGDGFAGATTESACTPPDQAVDVLGDCDDADARTFPGAVEVCDGLDNDCAGGVDDGVTDTFWTDGDGDGFGDLNFPLEACEPRDGLVANADDCDDAERAVHPGATELCNERDDDCDGEIDDGADTALPWYADTDGDGFGNAADVVLDCDEVPGRVSDNTDCDDAQAAVNPAAVELCNGIDDDCDGLVDDASAADPATWYLDDDGDGYGTDGASLSACDAPEGYVAAGGDCDDSSTLFNPAAVEADCTDPNDYNCDGSVGYADVDGDGWAACAECDDANAANHPGATEYCDGADNDCDGTVDEADAVDALDWYADADTDGYGDPAVATVACDAPAGTVADASDCDDTLSTVNPAAPELCNGIDDNCDGTIDEDSATDAATWYADADSDGYGDSSSPSQACSAPAGTVADATDCDDTRRSTNPGATEYCNTEDDDCNGIIDDSAIDARSYWEDGDGDGYGNAAVVVSACSTPVGYTRDDDDCDDADAAVNPAATEVCNLVDDDCNGAIDDGAGGTTTWYEDIDGDGYGDPTSTVDECSAPAGYVSDATDCEDADASINPAAIDDCDTLDNDCSGDIDDGGLCPCDVEYYGSQPYMMCDTALEWSPARTVCLTYGYDLVAVGSAAENSWLTSEVAARSWTAGHTWWMGLNDVSAEGSFVWSNGEAVVYTNWQSGEPNNSGNEDCTHAYTSGRWNDIPCTGYPARYICEP
jgi:hypothetical protein